MGFGKKAGLKLHRLERCMASDDPDFEIKAADILGPYLHQPPHAPSPTTTKIAKCKSRNRVRCAVYTRESSEERLEQSRNSLEPQRAASIAYIQNRKHEGWFGGEDCYDDGNFSEGAIDRSAPKRSLLTWWPEKSKQSSVTKRCDCK
jgi:hypothetical protein